MKGLVFTEFLEMVEDKFSANMVDTIIAEAQLSSEGAYTTLGNYDYRELIELVKQLSAHTDTPAQSLVQTFGKQLFQRFVQNYPKFFLGIENSFDFLRNVEEYIHIEVKKLYPDAELPSFSFEQPESKTLKMVYRSKRPFADLAHGLIEGCIDHFKETVTISREDLSTDGTCASFTMVKS